LIRLTETQEFQRVIPLSDAKRKRMDDRKLAPEDVQLHYFQRKEKEGLAFSEVVSPKIDRNGRIDQWPDGFFDEWEKSLDALLEPAGE
jgi:predicted ATPase